MTRLPMSLIPKHLGGTKQHPRQQISREEYDERRRSLAENKRLRQTRRDQLAAEKRSRTAQREDAAAAFDRQRLLAEDEFDYKRSLLGEEYGFRAQGDFRAEGIASRASRQDFQQRGELAGEAAGYQRALMGEEYGFRGVNELLSDERLAEKELLSDKRRQEREQLMLLTEQDFASQMAERGFDEAEASEIRQALIQEDRDDQLFGQEMKKEQYLTGVDAEKDFRQAQIASQHAAEVFGHSKEMANTQREWKVTDMLRERDWAVSDDWQDFDQELYRMGIQFDNQQEAAQAAQVLQMAMIDRERAYGRVDAGTHYFTEQQKGEISKANLLISTIRSHPRMDPREKTAKLLEAYQNRWAVEAHPTEVPLDEIPQALEDILRKKFGASYDAVSELPWLIDPETGKPELPRSYTPPPTEREVEQEQLKAQQEVRKADVAEYNTNLTAYAKRETDREAWYESHRVAKLDEDGDELLDGSGQIQWVYRDEMLNTVSELGWRQAGKLVFPDLAVPVHPDVKAAQAAEAEAAAAMGPELPGMGQLGPGPPQLGNLPEAAGPVPQQPSPELGIPSSSPAPSGGAVTPRQYRAAQNVSAFPNQTPPNGELVEQDGVVYRYHAEDDSFEPIPAPSPHPQDTPESEIEQIRLRSGGRLGLGVTRSTIP